MDKEEVLRKIEDGTLTFEDLEDPAVLEIAKRRLKELYPYLDLETDPAEAILNDPEFQRVINELAN